MVWGKHHKAIKKTKKSFITISGQKIYDSFFSFNDGDVKVTELFALRQEISFEGSSFNDVTVFGGGVKDFVTTVLSNKMLYDGGGGKKLSKIPWRHFRRPPITDLNQFTPSFYLKCILYFLEHYLP